MPEIEYVLVTADFQEDGTFLPRSLELETASREGEKTRRRFVIDRVLEGGILPCEEVAELFPQDGEDSPALIYRYKVKIGGRESSLYFDRWPESGAMGLGRWFVVRKGT